MSEELVNVLITSPLEEEYQRQIATVSPRIKVWDVLGLANAEQEGNFTSKERFDAVLAQAEVIYGVRPPKDVIARAPRLKWMQSRLSGVDSFLIPEIIESSVILTNSSGVHGTQISELVFTMMLMLAKQARLILHQQQEKRWQRFVPALLHSKTLGILGLGSVGKEVARLAKAFGMRVVAIESRKNARCRYADIILPPAQLREVLVQSDFLVVALPFTPETDKLIGEPELRKMKPTAYLINIARGGIVDEEALIRALDEHWIAGAGLDVFATEPLPPQSRLWSLPNVICSPHIAGQREDMPVLVTNLFCENLRRYLAGKKLLNVVDKKKGF